MLVEDLNQAERHAVGGLDAPPTGDPEDELGPAGAEWFDEGIGRAGILQALGVQKEDRAGRLRERFEMANRGAAGVPVAAARGANDDGSRVAGNLRGGVLAGAVDNDNRSQLSRRYGLEVAAKAGAAVARGDDRIDHKRWLTRAHES